MKSALDVRTQIGLQRHTFNISLSLQSYDLHLHRYVVPSQLTFTQRVDFGW